MPVRPTAAALLGLATSFALAACGGGAKPGIDPLSPESSAALARTFGKRIDLLDLPNYASQPVPFYITKDNSGANPITDAGAILGRVLFYDKSLSTDDTVACASCHQQALGFQDDAIVSTGVNGTTGRHSMRLVNTRFSEVEEFFWDRRATSLEDQTTQPIQDHAEMGFSGNSGAPDFDDLIVKLGARDYYPILFTFAFGDPRIDEDRVQKAIAQFVRSIQSFDTPYDDGLAAAGGDLHADFPDFPESLNRGKRLFMEDAVFNERGERTGGGAGCHSCHRAPEFDIDPASGNNGVVGVAGRPGEFDFTVTRSPSLRELVNLNGDGTDFRAMHDGSLFALILILSHYNEIPDIPENTSLDERLSPNGYPQKLGLSLDQQFAIISFLRTLTSRGRAFYLDPRWSDPFLSKSP